jgi:hypothetical protein
MASFPSALGFGIAGIVIDRRKMLAIIVTALAGLFVLFYLCMVGILVCMR